MRRYAIKRFLTVAPVLAGISIIVFSFIHRPPGDPAVTMLGERAATSTVKDPVAGSGICFTDRGTRVMKGIPGEWRLLAAT